MSSNPESYGSMFLAQGDTEADDEAGVIVPPETITVQDFFDFMKTAYQVYDEDDEADSKINWEELSKLTVLNHVIEQEEKKLLQRTATTEQKAVTSKSETVISMSTKIELPPERKHSCTEIDNRVLVPRAKVEMLGVWTETNLNCKLNDVINEGILDSILPYLVGYKKPNKTISAYVPVLKNTSSNDTMKKPSSFGGFLQEKESRDRLGRRKSSIAALQERTNQKQDGDVEIHVCDEVKGLKKDFRCPQKLLVSKMGYFADVTAGQRLEDMDISVHCDIQIFDWLMRWVKRDSILVADWLLLEPGNVVPILVSASFLQMEPLIHDCLIYCHAHMNDIVKTNTNLTCLSDALLTRLAAMYTNAELEAIRDRKDKIQSRLYCKMIMSLAEPVPETLRGHYATLSTLFKCIKCNKLLGLHIADHVPCQPAYMRIDRRGNLLSAHTKDLTWSLNDYISWLYGELRSWRRVYWRLWADCHFLKCLICDSYFPAYQMEWCCQHAQAPQMFAVTGRPPLPTGRHPCCGERAYRFETIPRKTGCTFTSHRPLERTPAESAVVALALQFRDLVTLQPPHLMFPERITRLVNREPGEEPNGRLQCKEVFWWEGVQLVPPRQPLGLLGKLYTSDNHFNPYATAGAPAARSSAQSLGASGSHSGAGSLSASPLNSDVRLHKPAARQSRPASPIKKGAQLSEAGDGGAEASSESADSEESSSEDASEASEEEACRPARKTRKPVARPPPPGKKGRQAGRQWIASHSARSNQDGQRRFEERAVRQMRAALARRAALFATQKAKAPPGGVYAKLEADWRERHCQRPVRNVQSARSRNQPIKK